jgi:hypothetical protein
LDHAFNQKLIIEIENYALMYILIITPINPDRSHIMRKLKAKKESLSISLFSISLLYTLRDSHGAFTCILNNSCLCDIQLELLSLMCH